MSNGSLCMSSMYAISMPWRTLEACWSKVMRVGDCNAQDSRCDVKAEALANQDGAGDYFDA